VIDVRWMAYILATAFWEAAHTISVSQQVPKLGKGGKPLVGPDGKPILITKTKKVWEVMVPINEINPADDRRYKAPVKVRKIDAGDAKLLRVESKVFDTVNVLAGAWIVEKDGDQFVFDKNCVSCWRSKKAALGAAFAGDAAAAYENFGGVEHTYIGRGYVQLTWWANYISSGLAIGRGLDLLFNPEVVKIPQVAYELMSHGMVTGEGFANGHKLSDYIAGTHKDYVNARKMANGRDIHSYQPIAELADLFEQMLLEAKQ
jgi:hypothetical protein